MEDVVLVTGCAGFIGFHLTTQLLAQGKFVVGVDSLNNYYSTQLKRDRLERLRSDRLVFRELDLANQQSTDQLFQDFKFSRVYHLAAQPGVRYSLTHPRAYMSSNLDGFLNILEGCRHQGTSHLIYASSSSVYGLNTSMPFSTEDSTDHPISLYGATKKANELMAHAYAHAFGLPSTGLRFFTVYGPWGRPDMAILLFARAITRGETIKVFNHGKMKRDFTYVDDIVQGILRVGELIPTPDPAWDSDSPSPASSSVPYRIFNIGNHQPVDLDDFIDLLEAQLGRKAIREYLPCPVGDVLETFADITDLQRVTDFAPNTPIEVGIERTMAWYKEYRLTNPDL